MTMLQEELIEVIYKNCQLLEKKAQIIKNSSNDITFEDQSKDLQNRIKLLEEDLIKKQKKRNELLRQVRNFKALTTFSSKQKNSTSKTGLKSQKSKINIIKMLSDYQNKNEDERILISINFLKGDINFENSLLINENNSYQLLFQRRKLIQDYQNKIVNIQQEIDSLGREYRKLILEQEETLRFQHESFEKKKKLENEFNEISKKIKIKEEEIFQIEDFEQQSIKLNDEIQNINNSINIDQELLTSQEIKEEEEYNSIEKEIEFYNEKCLINNKKIIKLKKKLNESIEEEKSLLNQKNNINNEEIKKELNKISNNSNIDPLLNNKFQTFLSQMDSKKLSPKDIIIKNKQKDDLEKQIKILQTDIENFETKEQNLNMQIQPKKDQISNLENSLKNLANKFDSQPGFIHQMPEFIDSAPSITFTNEEISLISKDQTAIIILFKDFIFDKTFIGKKTSQIYLVVDFLEHQSNTTNYVDINSGLFNSRLIFICKNDFILSEYLERTSVTVQLCRIRESQTTEAAKTELNLLPFVRGYSQMTQTVGIWNKSNKYVGKITFETAIYRSPMKGKSQ